MGIKPNFLVLEQKLYKRNCFCYMYLSVNDPNEAMNELSMKKKRTVILLHVADNNILASRTLVFLMSWDHVKFGRKFFVDDEKRMLISDAVPVKARRPLLIGAWSEKVSK